MRVSRRTLTTLVVLAVVAVAALAYVGRARLAPAPAPAALLPFAGTDRGPRAAGPTPRGDLWLLGDVVVRSVAAAPAATDVAAASTAYLFNPGPAVIRVRLRLFSPGQPPRETVVTVAAGRLAAEDLASWPDLPRDTPLWVTADADAPFFAQVLHAEMAGQDPLPETLEMPAPIPGPLTDDDRTWVYPDGFEGRGAAWHEEETLTILNPSPRDGQAAVAVLPRAGGGPVRVTVALPAERVAIVDLSQLPTGASVRRVDGDYAVLVDADVPIATQNTRRARWNDRPAVTGARKVTPLRLIDVSRTTQWIYAGGWTRRLGVLPIDDYTDTTWQLLFTLPFEARLPRATLTAYGTLATATPVPLVLQRGRAALEWLHRGAWRARLGVDVAWAVVVDTDGPLAPLVTAAEFEPYSQAMPSGMSSAPLTPGPPPRRAWLGVARHGVVGEADWSAAWQLFNPGDDTAAVTLQFSGATEVPIAQTIGVPPHAVVRVTGAEIPALPSLPVVVSVDADRPVAAHQWLRVGRREEAWMKALSSTAAFPRPDPAPAGR